MAETKKVNAKKVEFTFNSPTAKEVMLAGNFNNWNYKDTPLRKTENNLWKKALTLELGRYEYKFVVDGKWVTDPSNNNRSWSSLGTENSVIEIK